MHLVHARRTVQWLDAGLRTGDLKYQDRLITIIWLYRPSLHAHPFVQAWLLDENSRKAALRALL